MKSKKAELERFRNPVFAFGKYKGKQMLRVLDADPSYIVWCYNNIANHGGVSKRMYEKALGSVDDNYGDGPDMDHYDYDPGQEYAGFFDGVGIPY